MQPAVPPNSAYRVNERMRAPGIAPRRVGNAPRIDHAKYLGFALYRRVQRLLGVR